MLLWAAPLFTQAAVLWSHPDSVLAVNNGQGVDILDGAIKPHDSNSVGTIYFRVLVDPIADTAAKVIANFEAGFMLVEKGQEHLGIGNSYGAMAYSTLNVSNAPKGFVDLNSCFPDQPYTYEYMRAGKTRYLVLKIEFVPDHDAHVTAWLDPNLALGATEFDQPSNSVVHFEANATFDEIHLIHRGYGGGWKFSQMVAATSFEDLLLPHFWQRGWFFTVVGIGLSALVAGAFLLHMRRRAQREIHRLEGERAVAAERTRIARDIHDEVGASLAQIALMADMGMGEPAQLPKQRFVHIGRCVREVVAVMDEIVWAVNPQNDNLPQLADYLCQMADECFSDSPIHLQKEVPTRLPEFSIRAEVRHNLTLAVKEAFTNLLKHSQASQVRLWLVWNMPELLIGVEDNGSGFDLTTANHGNGLGNQRARLKQIGGTVELTSTPGNGTRIIFRIKFEGAR
ncbi:MAG TPA: ATP-binding protein [Verrucomicrobiae bacterium]|jgi:signal transduction histidine kinase